MMSILDMIDSRERELLARIAALEEENRELNKKYTELLMDHVNSGFVRDRTLVMALVGGLTAPKTGDSHDPL